MAKQEEIDWGLRKLIREWTGEEGTKYLYDFSKAIRSYLHSQRCRIEVDREAPCIREDPEQTDCELILAIATQKDMLKAGYVAVEPLVNEADETANKI